MKSKMTNIMSGSGKLILSSCIFTLVIILAFDLDLRFVFIPIIFFLGGILNMTVGSSKLKKGEKIRGIFFYTLGVILEVLFLLDIVQIWSVQ